MGILQTLKSLLGIDDSGSQSQDARDVGVTVERERSSEGEVGGTPTETPSLDEEAAAAGSTAAGSTDSVMDPPDEPEEAAEPAEATGPAETDATPTEETTVDEPPAEDVSERSPEEMGDESAFEEPDDEPSEPVDSIKGIGPAYADRLADAGVETVADLADADAGVLAEQTDISEKRLQGWIDRAEVR
ncbi:helix-hairpin-helix domain-containing protein [Natrialba swarupiae]|uniref:Helix-hairpin-helix domain-containing protein n=1 Tax=Natrialba swarupiae TaxID=2448032 RepID=A0A5D5APQ7_9EURY|nr:helix-hairpin-helix domain-containing protein [Natrialba swarupiae]TYT62875.1 helix-hairpin-helix domain-containing protein [Natrialba swarupiae]